MCPLAALAGLTAAPAQFVFATKQGESTQTPGSLLGRSLSGVIHRNGPVPVISEGRVVGYIIDPEDLALLERTEDDLAVHAVKRAYEEQGDRPMRDLEDVLAEFGL